MEKYKIKRNPKPLSDEQINRHKDFSKLLRDQQKLHRYKDGTKPLYKNPGLMGMMIVVGIVLLMLVLDKPENETQEKTKDSVAVVKADTGLQIPVDQNTETSSDLRMEENVTSTKTLGKTKTTVAKVIEYEIFKIDPMNGAALYTSSGLRLLVPALAFSDKVMKEVTLKFRHIKVLQEEGLKSTPLFTPTMPFELLGFESATGAAVTLSKPVIIEYYSAVEETAGTLYSYQEEKNEWQAKGKENFVYRFKIRANDSQFPELSLLTDLAWELPMEAGKPVDFNYIFNRTWRSFSYKTSDKKELAVKGTNGSGSFKGVPDIAPILGDSKNDQQLRAAFYNIYNFAVGRIKDEERQKKSFTMIQSWKSSKEGKEYQDWLKTESGDFQFFVTAKTSKISIDHFGIHCLNGAQNKIRPGSKRILTLEKYPERTQEYNQETEQN